MLLKNNRLEVSKSEKSNLLVPVFALVLGGFIYITFRENNTIFCHWLTLLGLESMTHHFPLIRIDSSGIPEWIIYSLPNGLWAFAYAYLISSIWKGNHSVLAYSWIATIPLLVLGFEFLQLFDTITGTFCYQDIYLGLSGSLIGILPLFKKSKQQPDEIKKN